MMNNVCGCAYLAQRATYNKTNKGKRLDGCFLVMYGNWGSSAENVLLSGLSCVSWPWGGFSSSDSSDESFLLLISRMRFFFFWFFKWEILFFWFDRWGIFFFWFFRWGDSLLLIRSLLLLLWGQCIRDALSLEVLSWPVQLLLLLQIQPREWCQLQCLLCARGLF